MPLPRHDQHIGTPRGERSAHDITEHHPPYPPAAARAYDEEVGTHAVEVVAHGIDGHRLLVNERKL